jgi:hypothetical protein
VRKKLTDAGLAVATKSAVAAALATLLSPVAQATPISYQFTDIADSSGPISFLAGLSINSAGTVAFTAGLDAGGFGIFTSASGPIATIVDSSGPFSGFGLPSINSTGTVAFRAFLDAGGSGIFTSAGATIATSGGQFSGFGDPLVNSAGTAVFRADLGPGQFGIFTGSGGPTVTIASTSDGSPSINSAGTVAFSAGLPAGGSGIFTSAGGSIATIATSGPFGGIGFTRINSAGTVAFSGSLDGGSYGIFTSAGGPITTIATTGGPFDFLGDYSINSAGTVAFSAGLHAGGTGIFTGGDPVNDLVIRTGDALFGSTVSTVTGFVSSSEGLNDAGQLAFIAYLADGRSVIVRADPITTPPPITPTKAPPIQDFPLISELAQKLPQFISANQSSFDAQVFNYISPWDSVLNALKLPVGIAGQVAADAALKYGAARTLIDYATGSDAERQKILAMLFSKQFASGNGKLIFDGFDTSMSVFEHLLAGNPLLAALDINAYIWGDYFAPAAAQFANDPPDPNFTSVYVVPNLSPPKITTGNPQLDSAFAAANRAALLVAQYLEAVNISLDRYAGALQANDALSATLQLEALVYYLQLYNSAVQDASAKMAALLAALQFAGVFNTFLDPSLLSNLQLELEEFGFDPETIDFLHGVGFTDAGISVALDAIIDLNPLTQSSVFDGLTAMPDILAAAEIPNNTAAEPSTLSALVLAFAFVFADLWRRRGQGHQKASKGFHKIVSCGLARART